jgi:hypothetical protein
MIPGTTNVEKFVQLREIRRKVNLGPCIFVAPLYCCGRTDATWAGFRPCVAIMKREQRLGAAHLLFCPFPSRQVWAVLWESLYESTRCAINFLCTIMFFSYPFRNTAGFLFLDVALLFGSDISSSVYCSRLVDIEKESDSQSREAPS